MKPPLLLARFLSLSLSRRSDSLATTQTHTTPTTLSPPRTHHTRQGDPARPLPSAPCLPPPAAPAHTDEPCAACARAHRQLSAGAGGRKVVVGVDVGVEDVRHKPPAHSTRGTRCRSDLRNTNAGARTADPVEAGPRRRRRSAHWRSWLPLQVLVNAPVQMPPSPPLLLLLLLAPPCPRPRPRPESLSPTPPAPGTLSPAPPSNQVRQGFRARPPRVCPGHRPRC